MIRSEFDLTETQCSYYNLEELNNHIDIQNKNLLIVHHNIRSFNRNFDELSVLLDQINHRVDIIVLSETWFVEGSCEEISGFVGHHVCRPEKINCEDRQKLKKANIQLICVL